MDSLKKNLISFLDVDFISRKCYFNRVFALVLMTEQQIKAKSTTPTNWPLFYRVQCGQRHLKRTAQCESLSTNTNWITVRSSQVSRIISKQGWLVDMASGIHLPTLERSRLVRWWEKASWSIPAVGKILSCASQQREFLSLTLSTTMSWNQMRHPMLDQD